MDITSIIALLGAMSLSVERVVEIIKNMFPCLSGAKQDPKKEGWRRAFLQFLAFVAGAVIAYVAEEQIQPLLSGIFTEKGKIGWTGYVIIGLLSSGGSGFWNQSMSIVEEIRKAKKLQVQKMKVEQNQK